MTTTYFATELAKSFIERAESLGYKGRKRDEAALDYFCGAAQAARFVGNDDLYQHLVWAIFKIVSVRGYSGVKQLAAITEKEPA
jgi:hypothetical protein